MEYRFDHYDPDFFSEEPDVLEIGDARIEYLSFQAPGLAEKEPFVILCGAFQDFSSFKVQVNRLFKYHPILIVNLPGQGSNRQVASDLSLLDLANLLEKTLLALGLGRIILAGFSYGSAIAYAHAAAFSERVRALILLGVAHQLRPSLRRNLERTMDYCRANRMKEFSAAVAQHLFNVSKLDVTRVPEEFVESLRSTMLTLSPPEKEKYLVNTERLLRLDGLPGRPACPTLVVTAEYDNFLTPNDNYQVARRLEEYTFVILADADHLAPSLVPRTLVQMYLAFLDGEPLSDIPGVRYTESSAKQTLSPVDGFDRRLYPRWEVSNELGAHFYNTSDKKFRVRVIDINYDGCLISPVEAAIDELLASGDEYFFELDGQEIVLPVCAFASQQGVRCVFLKSSTTTFRKFLAFLHEHAAAATSG